MKRFVALFVCFVAFVATSCGFGPMYGEYGTKPADLNNIRIENISSKYGQQLRNDLVDGMHHKGTPSNPRYSLKVSGVGFQQAYLGLDKTTTAETRLQLTVSANYILVDNETKEKVYENSVRSFVAYNALDSQFTTIVTRNDAIDRGIQLVAQRIVQDLALYLGNPNKEALKPKANAKPKKIQKLDQDIEPKLEITQ